MRLQDEGNPELLWKGPELLTIDPDAASMKVPIGDRRRRE